MTTGMTTGITTGITTGMGTLLPAGLAAAAVLAHGLPDRSILRLSSLHGGSRPLSAGWSSWLWRWAPGLAGLAGLLLGGPVLAALSAVSASGARHALRRRRAQDAAARERARLAEALGALAVELRIGRPVPDALDVAAQAACGPAAEALAAAAASYRWGGDLAGTLDRPDSAAQDALAALAVCLAVCARSGHGLAHAVERVRDSCRVQEEQRSAVETGLAGPRATAVLLAALPLAGLALAGLLGADPAHVLLGTPAGWVCVVLGVGLDGLGLLWARRIASSAASGPRPGRRGRAR